MESTVGAKWKRFSTLNAARRYIKRRSQRQVQIAIFGEGQAAVGFDTEGEETEEEEASLSQVYAREEAQLGKTLNLRAAARAAAEAAAAVEWILDTDIEVLVRSWRLLFEDEAEAKGEQ